MLLLLFYYIADWLAWQIAFTEMPRQTQDDICFLFLRETQCHLSLKDPGLCSICDTIHEGTADALQGRAFYYTGLSWVHA